MSYALIHTDRCGPHRQGEHGMNSLERVKAAIHFEGPDRVPTYWIGLSDVFPMAHLPAARWAPGHQPYEQGLFPFHSDDLVMKLGVWRWNKPEWARAPEYRHWYDLPREEVDEFGCIWNREGRNLSMGHPGRPVLTDWSDLEEHLRKYSPDPTDRSRYEKMILASKLAARNRYRMCMLSFPGPSHIAANLRGFTDYLVDHRRNPEPLKKLLAWLTEYNVATARSWVEYGARPHGFIVCDDLGTQTGPFLNPAVFEEFYEPVYRTIIEAAHDLGCEMHLHSCGKIDALMPMLIEWGLDGFEFDSPRTIGYEDLRAFRGKVMLWGCVDIQKVYGVGTPAEVEREVELMVENMGTPMGGFGAYFYPQTSHIGVPLRNVLAYRRGLKKYGTYTTPRSGRP